MNTEGQEFASDRARKEALVDHMMNMEGAGPCPFTRDQMRQFVDIGEHAAQQAMKTIVRVCGMIDEPTIAIGIALRSMAVANDSYVELAKTQMETCNCIKCQLERALGGDVNVVIVGD